MNKKEPEDSFLNDFRRVLPVFVLLLIYYFAKAGSVGSYFCLEESFPVVSFNFTCPKGPLSLERYTSTQTRAFLFVFVAIS